MEGAIKRLDVTAIVKASQAVSSEIELPKLIERLMTVALENAGADRGLLILPQANGYCVEAMAEVSGGEIVLRRGLLSGDDTPDSLVRYVIRSRESVILGDARRPNPFAGDEYLIRRQPRSVFCLPLVRQTALAGVLYLENTLTSDVFTPDRTALLRLLASQLAISLENTRLYSDLREREAKIRRLVDANIIGIFIWDLDGHILEANDALLCVLGYDREDLASNRLRWTDLTPPECRDRTARAGAEIGMAGAVQPFEKEYFRKDGIRVPVLIGSAAFDEQRDQGVAFVLDLTERKRAEAEARESERRYRETLMELAHANRVATMGQLTASITHEVKQPIASARNNARAALNFLDKNPPDLGEVREALGCIVGDADRAGDIIDRIRDHIKKAPPQDDRFDLNTAINEVIELAHSAINENGVSVQTRFTDELYPVRGDRVQVQQVVLNLVLNAIEAMGSVEAGAREVLISTEHSPTNDVLVSVRDARSGIASEKLQRAVYDI